MSYPSRWKSNGKSSGPSGLGVDHLFTVHGRFDRPGRLRLGLLVHARHSSHPNPCFRSRNPSSGDGDSGGVEDFREITAFGWNSAEVVAKLPAGYGVVIS